MGRNGVFDPSVSRLGLLNKLLNPEPIVVKPPSKWRKWLACLVYLAYRVAPQEGE